MALQQIGKIAPKSSQEIQKSQIGLGFEKLDRDIFDPQKAYPFVAASGIKWARLQSGWQKTEKEEGVYDFAWLDSIVDSMLAMGVEPWLCLCYGNKLYTEAAEAVFGAVGCPPIHTEREREAWLRYVKATVTHFHGRIHYYEVWNEPDGVWCWKHGPSADELAAFTIATAKACKEADGSCEVVGFVTCCHHKDFHEAMGEAGVCQYLDAISYHAYTASEAEFSSIFRFYDELRKKYTPRLKIIQGESGTQSRPDGCGALAGGAWTEEKQAKYLLRHLITDLALGVAFSSYFSCMDMAEALNGSTGDKLSIRDFGYFGVVGAEFDEEARSTGNYYAKPSYTALQHLTAVLCEDYAPAAIRATPVTEYSTKMLGNNFSFAGATQYAFTRPSGSTAFFYWKPTEILTETYEGETSFCLSANEIGEKTVRLLDMRSGVIYALGEGQLTREGGDYHFHNLPITDSPLLLDFGDFYQ